MKPLSLYINFTEANTCNLYNLKVMRSSIFTILQVDRCTLSDVYSASGNLVFVSSISVLGSYFYHQQFDQCWSVIIWKGFVKRIISWLKRQSTHTTSCIKLSFSINILLIYIAFRQQVLPLSESLNLLSSPKQRSALASQLTTRNGEPAEILKPLDEDTDKDGFELQLKICFKFSLCKGRWMSF